MCVILAWSLFGCGGSSTPTPPSVIQQPSSQTVTIGQVAAFNVTAAGGPPLAYQWQQNGQPIPGATQSSYTTAPTTTADDASQFLVVVSNSTGQVISAAAVLSVHPPPDVTTFHNDNLRTGQNGSETYLTPQNVSAATFGKVGFLPTDGKVDAQPLYLSNVSVPGSGTHNVVYVVTEHDSTYAFDADTFAMLWQASALEAGETSSDDRQCSDAVTPEVGITSTPVIDRSQGPNGAIYLVAATEDSGGNYHFRLHALDVAAGKELFGGPKEIQAQYPGTGDGTNGVSVVFDPAQYLQRPALLLANGTIYTTWASHCDVEPYTGWVIGYSESTLAQASVLNLTPNGNHGGIWMAGDGPAADSAGYVYLMDGNGSFDTALNSNGFPSQADFGNAFVKIAPTAPPTVTDFFAPSNTAVLSVGDFDIGSGGILLLPDQVDDAGKTWHLAMGSGKTGMVYVVDRDDMGKFDSTVDNIRQEIPPCCPIFGGLYGPMFSTPAYFNSTVYFGAVGQPIESFSVSNAQLSLPYKMLSSNSFPYPGATPSISANGVSNGLLWAVENGTSGILHAYDATNLANEVYNSGVNAARDQFGSNKFIVPTITNGRVYVGTPTGVVVFGLLPTTR
ncbi:MAG TPA: immunoglobulin domain-containing protein [Candidatus Sulfotelmatobacter sp.]